ncbi:unnamed protein product, partial [Scytosiphon promiscuus]
GTSAGWGRATALASVGRFVLVADVGAAGSLAGGAEGGRAVPSITAIDVNWLASGGYEAGMEGLAGDEECTWRVFRGGRSRGGGGGGGCDVEITSISSAGPRRVAV